MTLLFFSREYDTPQPFEPPVWAYTFESCDDMPYGEHGHSRWRCGYWWVELGGEYDSIHDTEKLRDELLKICYGVWDHLKNHCEHHDNLTNHALDWMQFLPGQTRKPPLRRRPRADPGRRGDRGALRRHRRLRRVDYGRPPSRRVLVGAHGGSGDDLPRGPLALRHSLPHPLLPQHRQPDVRRARRQRHARGDEFDARDGHLRCDGPGRRHGRRPRRREGH